ncbi:MAG TPA: hypothetical protein VJ795_16940, partial [Rheinheimera sp.]|uniref:hypothetical protein n=1 Tax=Rheinheimera sp. TaxID=1869214 RepID=UPI002B49B4A6
LIIFIKTNAFNAESEVVHVICSLIRCYAAQMSIKKSGRLKYICPLYVDGWMKESGFNSSAV